jgi:uncharacterized protein with beta-barrel porin domain
MNSKILIRPVLAAFAAFLAAAVSTAQPAGTQAVLTGTSDWQGVDSDYFNASNWSSGVPTGQTDIRLMPLPSNKTVNIAHSGATDRQVDIYSIRAGSNYTYTLNLTSADSGTLTFNITGRGTHPFAEGDASANNGDGTSVGNASYRHNFTINMGNNTRITFSPDAYEGNNGNTGTPITTTGSSGTIRTPLPGKSTSGLTYAFLNMTGNAVLDMRTMDDYFTISSGTAADPGSLSLAGTALVGGFNIGQDATVYLGFHRGTLSQGVGAGTEEKWEGLLIQDDWVSAEADWRARYSNGDGYELPEDITDAMLHISATNVATALQSEKWGTGITRVTTTGTVIHPGNMRLRGANGGYVVDGYHRGPILADTNGSWVGGKGNIFGNVTLNTSSNITGGDRGAIGTLTITGTLAINNGTLSIDLLDYNTADKIIVNGDMVIGELAKLAAAWTTTTVPIQAGTQTFRVLEVNGGGITGDFNPSAVTLPNKIRQQGSYVLGSNYLDIILTGYDTFSAHPTINHNYLTVASIVDVTHGASGSSADKAIADRLYTMFDALPSVVYVKQAIDQLTPIVHQAWFPSAVLRTNSMVQSVEDRLMQDAGYGRAKGSVQTYLQGWWQESSRQADIYAPYSNYATTTMLAGVDYAFAENTVAGGWLAYETTDYDYDLNGGSGKGKGLTLGVYGRHNIGSWQFNAAAFYGTDNYDTSRDISMIRSTLGTLAKSDTDGSRMGVALSAAYTYKHPWVDVTPVLGLQWLNWKADGFTETGWDSPLVVGSQSEVSLQARLGVRFSRAFESSRGLIRPYLHMAYVREFETGEREMEAELLGYSYTLKVPGIEANGMRVDAGIDWQLSKAWRWDLHYTAQYNGACDESMGIRAGVTFAF